MNEGLVKAVLPCASQFYRGGRLICSTWEWILVMSESMRYATNREKANVFYSMSIALSELHYRKCGTLETDRQTDHGVWYAARYPKDCSDVNKFSTPVTMKKRILSVAYPLVYPSVIEHVMLEARNIQKPCRLCLSANLSDTKACSMVI